MSNLLPCRDVSYFVSMLTVCIQFYLEDAKLVCLIWLNYTMYAFDVCPANDRLKRWAGILVAKGGCYVRATCFPIVAKRFGNTNGTIVRRVVRRTDAPFRSRHFQCLLKTLLVKKLSQRCP